MSQPKNKKITTEFFAIVREHGAFINELRRLDVSEEVQLELHEFFDSKYREMEILKAVSYAPLYEISRLTERFQVTLNSLPEFLTSAIIPAKKSTIKQFEIPIKDKASIKGIAAYFHKKKLFVFQAVNSGKIFDRTKQWYVFDSGTFSKLSDYALRLGDKIDGYLHDLDLSFVLINSMKHLVGIDQVYEEASNSQIEQTLKHENISNGEEVAAEISKKATQKIRKLMTYLEKEKVLDGIEQHLGKLQEDAKLLANCDLVVEDNQIVFPTETRDLTDLLEFLCDCYYQSPTRPNVNMYSNSHRPI
jgi:Domain of unknown function (DUF4868)